MRETQISVSVYSSRILAENSAQEPLHLHQLERIDSRILMGTGIDSSVLEPTRLNVPCESNFSGHIIIAPPATSNYERSVNYSDKCWPGWKTHPGFRDIVLRRARLIS